MCHIADMRMMKSRRSVSNPPPLQEGEVMAQSSPTRAILANKQHLSVEHVLTSLKRYAAACRISFLQSHPHAIMHIVRSHTLPLSVYTAYLLPMCNNVIESTTGYTITYKTLGYSSCVSATEWMT